MAYRIDVNARYRFHEEGDAATAIPPATGEAFRQDIDRITREREGRGDERRDQPELGDRIFVVEPGDTLEDIARENLSDPVDALAINADENNSNGDLLHPGDIIILPAPEPELVAETAADETGEPAGEDEFVDALFERGNSVEYADPADGIDTTAEIAAMKQDVAGYLAALPPEARQAAALRLSEQDWVDAGPAGIAVSEAVEEAGLESDPIEAFASDLYDRGNALEYADSSANIDQSREISELAGEIDTFLQTLPEDERTDALQNLYDRSWTDAGPAQIAIEQAAETAGIFLKSTGHNGPQTEAAVRSIVDDAVAASDDGELQFRAFAESYASASPELREALLRTGYANDFMASTADYATEPLGDFDPASDMQAKPYETFLRLDAMTEGASPELAAELVSAAMPEIERANALYQQETGSPMLGVGGVETLLKIADRIEGTTVGDGVIESFADMGFYAQNELTRSIGEGGSLQYPLELSERNSDSTLILEQDILPGVQQVQAGANTAVEDYSAHMEEMRWLIENHGDTMSPEELEQAISDYKTEKGDEWRATEERLEADVAEQGETLLTQVTQLSEFPDEPAEQKERINEEIDSILNDDRSYLAIQAALRTNPELLDSPAVLNFASQQAKLTDRGRKLTEEIFTQFVQRDVLPKLSDLDLNDASKMQEVRDSLAQFRDSKFATLLGVTEKDMNKAIDALDAALPVAGDTPESIELKMSKLNDELSGLDSRGVNGIRSFSSSTIPGQVLRSIGAGAAAATLFNSTQTAFTQPGVDTVLKATFDAVGLWQRSVEIRKGLDMIDPDSFASHFDSGVKLGPKVLGVLGAGFDAWNSYSAFKEGDPLMGGIHAATAAGGVTAALGAGSIAGPIGVGVVILGVGASMVVADVREKNKYETEISTNFLAHAAVDRDVAEALTDNSGEGYSAVPLLIEYASDKGLDVTNAEHRTAFTEWLNSMSPDQLSTLRDNLHHTIDEFGGDATKLEETATDDYEYTSSTFYDREVVTPYKTIFGERTYVEDGDASPSSVTQIDIALGTLGIPELAIPTS